MRRPYPVNWSRKIAIGWSTKNTFSDSAAPLTTLAQRTALQDSAGWVCRVEQCAAWPARRRKGRSGAPCKATAIPNVIWGPRLGVSLLEISLTAWMFQTRLWTDGWTERYQAEWGGVNHLPSTTLLPYFRTAWQHCKLGSTCDRLWGWGGGSS